MTSQINIKVTLNDKKIPENIEWAASESFAQDGKNAKAMILSFWDGSEKAAYNLDLWTSSMMTDEMNAFVTQTLFSIADTYQKATQDAESATQLKNLAKVMLKNYQDKQGIK